MNKHIHVHIRVCIWTKKILSLVAGLRCSVDPVAGSISSSLPSCGGVPYEPGGLQPHWLIQLKVHWQPNVPTQNRAHPDRR